MVFLVFDCIFATVITSADHLTISRAEVAGLHPHSLVWQRKQNWLAYLGRFRHRARAALRAISFRLAFESLAARAFPPLAPPSEPKATAAGFFFRCGGGVSSVVPVDTSTMNFPN